MFHHQFEDENGNFVMELDREAIDHLIEGLEELRDMDPGEELATPSLEEDGDSFVGVAEHILRRHPDE